MLIAVGITTQIGIQTVLNLAVVSNLIPNTGISLPFFSYGGTALVMQLVEMGIMLNISQHRYYPEENEALPPAPEPEEPEYDEPKNA
jgi:cell division protein FtsW